MNIFKIIKENYNNYIEESTDFDETVEKWMSGECIPFAVALSEIFPEYKIAVLNDEFDVDDEDIEFNYNFVHAFCYHPSNDRIIIDAKGVRRLKELYDDFYDVNKVIDWDIPNSKFLIDNFAGKEFYSEESFDYDVSEYNEAKEWILQHKDKYMVK